MNIYRITNRVTGEKQDVRAGSAQGACEALRWMIGDCHVENLTEKLKDLAAFRSTYLEQGLWTQAKAVMDTMRTLEDELHEDCLR